MALITRRVSGFYVDGFCEVFARYNDVTHILKEIIVQGVIDRVVGVMVNEEIVTIDRNNTTPQRFDLTHRNITYFVSPDDAKNDCPRIICTYYAQRLTRADVAAGRIR